MTVQDQAQKLIDTLAEYDQRMLDMVDRVPEALEVTKEGLASEEDIVQIGAENIVFATTITSSNLDLIELALGIELDSEEDLANLPDFNRMMLEAYLVKANQAFHLGQLLSTLYSRLVEPLEKDTNGDLIPPAGFKPSGAVDKILQTVQGEPKVVEATMHGEFVVDL